MPINYRITVTCETCQKEFHPWFDNKNRFCSLICWRKSQTPEKRFWEKVDKNGPVPEYAPHLGNCWLWTGSLDSGGYGCFRSEKSGPAHVFSYELEKGPVPNGLELDHLCRVRRCVRPSHLEPVTGLTNVLRGTGLAAVNAKKTHCKYGHEFTESNTLTRILKNGRVARQCRMCNRPSVRKLKSELKILPV